MKDFDTWLQECGYSRIFRMLEYRRVGDWTPYEIEKKFVDQFTFKDTHYAYVKIKEAVKLPDDDVLLGVQFINDSESLDDADPQINYRKLSQIELSYFPNDQNRENW